MALGVFITYRILDIPDLTVDGSLLLVVRYVQWSLLVAVILGQCFASIIAGFIWSSTGLLHTLLDIPLY